MRPQPSRTVDHHLIKRGYTLSSRRHHAIETDHCHTGAPTAAFAAAGHARRW
jgi:hypothetical protein